MWAICLSAVRWRAKAGTVARNPFNLYKYVPRFLDAMESLFYRTAEYGAMRGTAIRLAQERGLDPTEARRWAEEAIYGTEDDRAAAKQQADEERERYRGTPQQFSEADYLQRLDELNQLRRAQKDPQLVDGLNRFALHSTYREAPGGFLGGMSRALVSAAHRAPAIRQVVPFITLPTNVANEMLSWTPLGAWRARHLEGFYEGVPGLDWSSLSETEKTMLGDEYMTKAMVGSGILMSGLLYTWFSKDDPNAPLQFHGQGPSDPEQNRLWRAAGNLPYSVKIGSVSLPMEATPFKVLVGAIGGLNDLLRYDKIKPGNELVDAAAAVGWGSLKPLLSASYLSGLQNFSELVSGGPGTSAETLHQRWENYVAQQFGSWATIPLGGTAARQIQKAIDPTVFQAKGFGGTLIRNVPLVNDAFLGPRLNALGDPVQASSWDRFVRVQSTDPIYNFIADRNVKLALPNATATYMPSGQLMNPDEYSLFVQRRGGYIKDEISRRLENPAFNQLPTDQLDDIMRQIEKGAGSRAKVDVVGQFGYGEPTARRHR